MKIFQTFLFVQENTIGHATGRGEQVVPSDVGELVDVNVNEESYEDC